MASSLYFKFMEFCGSPLAATYNSPLLLAFCLLTLIRLQQLGKEQSRYILHHSSGIKWTATMADKFRGGRDSTHTSPSLLSSLSACSSNNLNICPWYDSSLGFPQCCLACGELHLAGTRARFHLVYRFYINMMSSCSNLSKCFCLFFYQPPTFLRAPPYTESWQY